MSVNRHDDADLCITEINWEGYKPVIAVVKVLYGTDHMLLPRAYVRVVEVHSNSQLETSNQTHQNASSPPMEVTVGMQGFVDNSSLRPLSLNR